MFVYLSVREFCIMLHGVHLFPSYLGQRCVYRRVMNIYTYFFTFLFGRVRIREHMCIKTEWVPNATIKNWILGGFLYIYVYICVLMRLLSFKIVSNFPHPGVCLRFYMTFEMYTGLFNTYIASEGTSCEHTRS